MWREQILELAPIAVYAVDPDTGAVVFWNAAAESLYGWSAAEVLGKPQPHVPDSEVARLPDMLEKLLLEGTLQVQDLVRRRKDGTPVLVDVSAAWVPGEPGESGIIVAFSEDVTQRKADEEALRRANERLQRIIEYAPIAIYGASSDTRVVSLWNPATEQLFGWRADEVLGKRVPTVPAEHGTDRQQVLAELDQRGGSLLGREVVRQRKDGTLLDISLSLVRLPVAPGEPDLLISFSEDITERKASERSLKEAHAELATIVEASPAAIWTRGADRMVESWNPAAERIFGWRADEVVGKPLPIIPPGGEAQAERFRAVTAQGGTVREDVQRVRKDGTVVEVALSLTRLSDGTPRTVGVAEDITERKQAESARLVSQRLEAMGRLAGGVAHDFNNLLTVILGCSDALLERTPGADQDTLRTLRSAAESAAALTRELLAVGQRAIVAPRPVDLAETLRQRRPVLERMVGALVELRLEIGETPAAVLVDPAQVDQVLFNLASNAADAMPDGGSLTFRLAEVGLPPDAPGYLASTDPGKYWRLSVTDTGTGMAPGTVSQIFEPFFTTKAQGKGTGLGLATVYAVLRQHGGQVQVESAPGRGSTFHVYLPSANRPADVPALPPAPLDNALVVSATTVLLAEDHDAVRALCETILKRAGYQVLSARNGQEAWDLAQHHQGMIHAVLTDMVMPVMGGRELADRLAEVMPSLPVLFMSGYSDDVTLREGVAMGTVAFIQKPFRPSELTEKLRVLLSLAAG